MTEPVALKSCGHCGGDARMARAGLDWFVHCEKCFCCTDHMDTPEDARDVWNTRVPQPSPDVAGLVERIAELEAGLAGNAPGAWVPAEQFIAQRKLLEKAAIFIGEQEHSPRGQAVYDALRAALAGDSLHNSKGE